VSPAEVREAIAAADAARDQRALAATNRATDNDLRGSYLAVLIGHNSAGSQPVTVDGIDAFASPGLDDQRDALSVHLSACESAVLLFEARDDAECALQGARWSNQQYEVLAAWRGRERRGS